MNKYIKAVFCVPLAGIKYAILKIEKVPCCLSGNYVADDRSHHRRKIRTAHCEKVENA